MTEEHEMDFEGVAKPRGTLMSRTALAAAIGKATTTLDRWIREGFPVFQRGDAASRVAHQIDLAAAWDWAMARAREEERKRSPVVSEGEEAYETERARDKAAQATLREIAVEEKLKRLVPITDVHAHLDECSGLVRNAINALHTQVRDLTADQRADLVRACDAALAHVHAFVPPEADVTALDFGDSDDDSFG